MSATSHRTALVTGASSGLGKEAAAQLAGEGFDRVIITARTSAKAEAARAELEAATNTTVFETLVLELDDHASVEAAARTVAEKGGKIDVVLLNAGLSPTKDAARTTEGLEATVAATLIGHHLLTIRLLEAGLLSEQARIVIAGSEAARGDVPMFKPIDINALATESFSGDLEAAIEGVMRLSPPIKYDSGDQYATVKMFAAWWASELAGRLPQGMTVNAVSPGSTPYTNADRNAPFLMKRVLVPFFKLVPGMSHTLATGARRYIDAAAFGPEHTGKFFASKPKKMTGQLHSIKMDHFDDQDAQRALWNVTSRVAGGVGFPA
jgi:NAD(P)-dependent dehydrogenase (short-subunit alcohol dehydrogenase family)